MKGDIAAGSIIDFKFNTVTNTGAPITLGGSAALACYKDNSLTQSTAGLTLSIDFDSETGLHNVRVDTSADGTFYAAASNFQVVLSVGTVNGIDVAGYVVGEFSIANRSALRPTTAGRSLDVSSGGEAGIDWANVGSPTTAVNLSATNIDVDQIVASVSGAVGSVTGLSASIDDLPTNAELATALAAADDAVLAAIVALAALVPSANANADALLDRAAGVETGMTPRQAFRIILAALAGKASGLDPDVLTPTFRDTNDTVNRITAVTDEFGNRTSVTLNTG
jgi:hypothetical protein